MEKEIITNHLLKTVDLCSTIMEGLVHLGEHNNNFILQQETVLALETVIKSFEELAMEPWLIETSAILEEVVRNGNYKHEINWHRKVAYWYTSVLQFLSQKIEQVLESCPYCGADGNIQYSALLYEHNSNITPLYTEVWCPKCGKKWRL